MRTRIALAATIAAVAATGALLTPAAAGAAGNFPQCSPDCDLVVDSTIDAPDAKPGDGRCATAGGKCTLRAAVQEANASTNRPPFQSKILVGPGTYVLTRHGLDDNADRGDLDLRFFGEVIGAGQGRTTIDGDAADRVFDLHAADERVAHLAVTNGRATDGAGGGIRAGVRTWLEYLYVTDNVAVPGEAPDSGLGGGIAGLDTLIFNSQIAYNHAQDGAGVWWHGAQSSIGFDALVFNHATRDGGGLYFSADDASLGPLTISGNTAGAHGGGLFLASTAKLFSATGSTIASNSAAEGGGGGVWRAPVDAEETSRTAAGLIVARNGDEDCAGDGPLTSAGGNIDGDGSCGFALESDRSGVDPMLAPLAYGGGASQTRALLAGSPAISLWECQSASLDQRGADRPQGPGCDAGAYEVGNCCPALEPPYKPGKTPPPGPHNFCGLIVKGTNGPDLMVGDSGRNVLRGRGGNDRIFGRSNADCLFGGGGNDFVKGGAGHDGLFGGDGNDVLSGGDQEDIVLGLAGRDRIYGGADEDRLYGGGGDDYIKGGGGYDRIIAGPGNDRIDASGKGLDTVDCGSGFDRVKAKRLEHLYRCERVSYVD